ncbi:hypothetical protein AB0D78_47420 [Streptomyces avermitilis]
MNGSREASRCASTPTTSPTASELGGAYGIYDIATSAWKTEPP